MSLGFAGRCPLWPTAVCPCVTLSSWLCVPPQAAFAGDLGVRSSLALSHLRGFHPRAPPGALPRLPPSTVADGLPASVTGGSEPGRSLSGLLVVGVWGSSGLLCACGLSCCPCRLWLFLGAVPRGCSTLISLLLPSPWLMPRDVSIIVCSCMVLCAYLSPQVDLCVRVCSWVWLPVWHRCCPPAVFLSRRTNGGRPSFPSWVSTSAGLLLSPVAAPSCVLRGSVSVGFLSDELVPSHCRISCLAGVA
jgi:hypothetical protein